MKKLNILLNIYILCVIIFFIYMLFVNFIEPNLYNRDSTGRNITNYNKIEYVDSSLNNYFNYYFDGDIESIKACNIKNNIMPDENYNEMISYIKDNSLDSIYIKSIQKKFGDIYIVTFYLNSDEEYCNENNLFKCIFKLNMSNSTFKVYYDGLVDKGE